MQRKVEIAKEQRPSGLATIQLATCHEIGEILVVAENFNRMASTLKEMSPRPETFIDCQKFLVVDRIVSLSGDKLAGEEGDRTKFCSMFLGENA